jgi:AcrR family transcriptional regulator
VEQSKNNEQRQTRILDAAERLITRFGYGKTTVSDIAQEAGISKGAIYLHYSSKEELFGDLLMRASEQVMIDFGERLKKDHYGGTMGGVYSTALIAIAANPLTKALYSNDRRVLGDIVRHIMNTPRYQPLVSLGIDFVKQSQEAGLIRSDLSSKAVTTILMALRYGILLIDDVLPRDQQADLEELGNALGAILHEGLNPNDVSDKEVNKTLYINLVDQAIEMLRQQRNNPKEAKDE